MERNQLMKVIIHGKQYDTKTARLVAVHRNDFNSCCEELYYKRTGEYFIAGQKEISSGKQIKPLTESEAKEWAEQNMKADEYKKEFCEAGVESIKIGNYIKKLREEAELTQGELSKRLGVSQPRIAAMERGEVTTITTIKQIIDVFNIRSDEKLLELFKVLLNSGEVG